MASKHSKQPIVKTEVKAENLIGVIMVTVKIHFFSWFIVSFSVIVKPIHM